MESTMYHKRASALLVIRQAPVGSRFRLKVRLPIFEGIPALIHEQVHADYLKASRPEILRILNNLPESAIVQIGKGLINNQWVYWL